MIVDLVNHTCSCNKWQIFRIPCAHGIAACNYFRLDWKSLVGHWYKWSHVQQCYSTRFSPIGDEINWGDPANFPQLIPDPDPRRIRSRGKPRKKRFKMEMDIRGSCGNCGRMGHNARNCTKTNNWWYTYVHITLCPIVACLVFSISLVVWWVVCINWFPFSLFAQIEPFPIDGSLLTCLQDQISSEVWRVEVCTLNLCLQFFEYALLRRKR